MMSRQTLRKTLKWLGMIVLLIGTAAGGYGYWLWNHCDEYLLKLLIQKQHEIAPEWDVEIGRAHFDWYRRVHVYDVKIKAKGQQHTIATLPEIVIKIDRELFQNQQQIEIESVHLINPSADLLRDVEGRWNWHELLTLERTEKSLPEWSIEQGTMKVRFEQPDNLPATEILLSDVDGKLIPSGKRQFTFVSKADFNDQGKLAIKGDWNVDARKWSVTGLLSDMQHTQELLQLAAGTSEELRRNLAEFHADLERARVALTPPEEIQVADNSNDPSTISLPRVPAPVKTNPFGVPDFGLDSTLDLRFHIAQTAPGTKWDLRTAIDLKQGTLSHPVLPFPLRGLAGEVYWDNERIEFRNLTAQNGTTRIALRGKLDRNTPQPGGHLDVELTNLILDRRLRSRLPQSLRNQFDTVQPSGPADVKVTLHREPGLQWEPRNFVLTAKGCGTLVQAFRYPVTDITGTMKQQENQLVFDLIGQAGGRQVNIRGEIKDPGPAAETWLEVNVRQFPLDDRFRQACSADLQTLLDKTNLTGWADVHFSLYRPGGPAQKFVTHLRTRLSNCEVMLEAFPYRVTDLDGFVTYHSDKQTWSLQDLRGEHGTATLTAFGEFRQAIAPGVLNMTITTKGAAFDESLHQALPSNIKTVWTNFSPAGKFDNVCKIRWVPNMGFEWSLPSAVIYDGRMQLKAFPLALSELRAELSYVGDTCQIKSFTAKHDDTRIRGRGTAIIPPQGKWELTLLDLFADDISPDRQFRQALPSGVRTIVEELDPLHPFSLSGAIALSGTERETDPITAAWSLNFVFTGNQLNTGIQLKNVHGQVSARGTWDGKVADNAGQIALESVEVLDYQLTKVHGPYSIEGNKVTIGSQKVFNPDVNQQNIPLNERLTAEAIEGTLTYDAEVFLEREVRYRSRLMLINGRLEEYARRYLPGTKNLSGVMNGWLNFSGQGVETNRMTGTGHIRISPAALYELPIFARMFQVLALSAPDKTAFRLAEVDFDISKNQFVFKEIDLAGDSLSLRGLGTVGFDGRLNLDFYSMLPRARLPWPVANLVNPVLDQATKDWVKVEVRGKTSQPDVKMTPVPVVNETIKQFLGILGTTVPEEMRMTPPKKR